MSLCNYFVILGSFCVTVIGAQSTPCITPNRESATCVSLLSCPVLLAAAGKDPVSKKFVEASVCAQGALMVCCGKSGNFTQPLDKIAPSAKPLNESSRDYVLRKKLLPSTTYCGMQHTDDYFYNKTETSVDEFPWLVYFVIPQNYVNNYYMRKESNCVGVLISNRYVLTSFRDCYVFTTTIGGINNTVEMIFGQHHIYKDVSCIPTQFGIDDCTQPILRELAYTWYAAPSFFTQEIPSKFGVSIVRLMNKIDFSDFVRPICLPLDKDDMPKPDDVVLTSGWGEQQSVDGKSVKLKKRIRYTVMGNEECESGNPVQRPICGVPFDNNTHYVCPGDNGGPMMYRNNNNWFVAGIVSKTTTCDDIHPVIAERLTPETLDWIFDAIVLFEDRAKIDSLRQ